MFVGYKNISKAQCIDSGMAIVLITLLMGNVVLNIHALNFVAMALLIITMSIPIILKFFAYFWLNLSYALGSVISKLVLSFIFFILVTPVGMMLKIFKKDMLNIKAFKKSTESVFETRNHVFKKIDLQYPY